MERASERIPAKNWVIITGVYLSLLFCYPVILQAQQQTDNDVKMNRLARRVSRGAVKFARHCVDKNEPLKISKYLYLDSITVDEPGREIAIYYNWHLGEQPFREENVATVYNAMRKLLGWRFRHYQLRIYSKKFLIEELIPNYYRADIRAWDRSRLALDPEERIPIVRNVSQVWQPDKGLQQRNIALWHSHGWYYEHREKRWKWQRARLFQTVEDLFPMAFAVPYLAPMLENAGANVFIPRERDVQTHEVIVDFDNSGSVMGSYIEIISDSTLSFQMGDDSSGFADCGILASSRENPFRAGSYRYIHTDSAETASTEYIPNIPADGQYAVYISYVSLSCSISDAHYTIYHTGGKTEFLVNQQIGGGTWVYLGTFRFRAGRNPNAGRVVLSNQSRHHDGIVTADAVRFGGGMGTVAREGCVSERPRFCEAARYYLQYAGFPDTLVFNLNNDSSDYIDDFQCRGEWVNYLRGAPFGPTQMPDAKGLGVPIDLSLAFHTDAGTAGGDSIIGTQVIYNTDGADTSYRFPDGQSRLANRDLADILQTQITNDLRRKYNVAWNRRTLQDRNYSEAWRPNVPAVLLELLSHQNFQDMQFGNDPRFRFDVSRSIYKALLRFMASQYQTDYIVQPLPVSHFHIFMESDTSVTLGWRMTPDPLESSAVAEKYVVYTRIEDGGFDNGMLVDKNYFTISDLIPGIVYSFKVTAVNAGGESFPSEVLSVCLADSGNPLLIVNGFDRVAAPASLNMGRFQGFMANQDQGVPDGFDLNYTGEQYDFWTTSSFLENDSPGHGASYSDYESRIIAGNTHDFVYCHGQSVRAAGFGFVSASDEAIMDGLVDLNDYAVVDVIMGEERSTYETAIGVTREFQVFPTKFQQKIRAYCQAGGNLFISGAYIGSDPWVFAGGDSLTVNFVGNCLKYRWQTNHAVRTGKVVSVDSSFLSGLNDFSFNTELNDSLYAVESPDAIVPADTTAFTVLRYRENNTSAAIGFRGDYQVLAFGFPFESVIHRCDRDRIMESILTFFRVK